MKFLKTKNSPALASGKHRGNERDDEMRP